MSHGSSFARTLLVTACFLASLAPAAASDYETGLRLYQSGNFVESVQHLESALRETGESPLILYNLGLSHMKSGSFGRAVASWRRAVYLSPGFSPALLALTSAQDRLTSISIPHEMTLWESFRASLLSRVNTDLILGLTLISMLLTGWTLISFFGLRTQTSGDEPRVSAPKYMILASTVVTLGVVFLAGKLADYLEPRATVISKMVDVRAGPGPAQTPLFTLSEGLEVLVKGSLPDETGKNWLRVRFPGGPSGWIPSDSVIQTSGRSI